MHLSSSNRSIAASHVGKDFPVVVVEVVEVEVVEVVQVEVEVVAVYKAIGEPS